MILRSAKKRVKVSYENEDTNENSIVLNLKDKNIINNIVNENQPDLPEKLIKLEQNIDFVQKLNFDDDINENQNQRDNFKDCIYIDEDIQTVQNKVKFCEDVEKNYCENQDQIKKNDISKQDFFNLHLNPNNFNEDTFVDYEKKETKNEILNFESSLGRCKFIQKVLEIDRNFEFKHFTNIKNLYLKKRILDYIDKNKFTNLQNDILNIICSYKDFLFTEFNNENMEEIRFAYCLHVVNHVMKTRTRVINNNQKFKKLGYEDLECKDQGFTRPKILILLPFKNSAYNLVNLLIKFFVGNKVLKNKEFKKKDDKKHSTDERCEEDNFEIDYNEQNMTKEEETQNDDEVSKGNITVMNYKKFKSEFYKPDNIPPKKPDDYKIMFAGNNEEYFRFGIEFTKRSCKLYSKFYSSDIIIASPLGLRTIIGAEGEKKSDYDFLSSIEILIMDQTEIFLMQNWEHLTHIMNHLNLQPKDHHNTDFSRIRMWLLDGLSKYFRQTIVLSSTKSLYISSLFMNSCENYEGKIIQSNFISSIKANICKVLVNMEHKFYRFTSKGLEESADTRFKYFIETIIPKFNNSTIGHTLVFIPSYFDFIRIRNYMRNEEISFTHICEHTDKGKMAQSRKWFFTGQRIFLLYTERAHFYNRYYIKGIHNLIFYQLPTYSKFYVELCNLLIETNQRKDFINDGKTFSCTVLYDKFDSVQLVDILGNAKAKELLNSFVCTFKSDQNIF